jgi:hypothetical protein
MKFVGVLRSRDGVILKYFSSAVLPVSGHMVTCHDQMKHVLGHELC